MLVFVSLLTSILFSLEFLCCCFLFLLLFKKKISVPMRAGFVLVFLLLSMPISSWVIWKQERQFKPLKEVPSSAQAIVVLGSGGVPEPDLSIYQRLDASALQRTLEGIRIWKMNPEKLLVFSSEGRKGYPSQAAMYAEVAKALGVPSERIFLLEQGITTETEALDFITHLPEIKEIVLVTSALHLSRATRIFEVLGIQVTPAPAEFVVKVHPGGNRITWFPSFNALNKWNSLIHEWVGMAWIEVRVLLGLFATPPAVN